MFEDPLTEGAGPAPTEHPPTASGPSDPLPDWHETGPAGVSEAGLRRAIALATLLRADDAAEADRLMAVVLGNGPDTAA
ncbi:hypothetical protein, partial [Nocardia abscessus]